jgi:transposase InsO family protein
LGLDAATLADWRRRWQDPQDRLGAHTLGAPALLATPAQRLDVQCFLVLHGTALSLHTLHEHFPHLARRDLACLLYSSRAEAERLACEAGRLVLTWRSPGAVWAMDHTAPPTPIEGDRRKILTVRDLTTGCVLAAHAVYTDDAASTIALLHSLFLEHTPPLVIKADNGPAFTAHDTRDFLAHHRVTLLLSPPYCPSYNGACEAGNGVIKHLTHDLACRHGRPGHWTLDDLEAARQLANHRITDRAQTFTPEQRFANRCAVTNNERDQFASAVRSARRARLRQLAIAIDPQRRSITADALERQAIADALLGSGVLTIRRCRVRLPNQAS